MTNDQGLKIKQTQRQRVSDGQTVSILEDTTGAAYVLILVWPQLGDFDSLEYAWWLQKHAEDLKHQNIAVRAVGIGDRASGEKFCGYTGFPSQHLFVDPDAKLHRELGLYEGLKVKLPGLSNQVTTWIDLLLMCAGIGSPGTLAEVFRGYKGDRKAPQLIADDETIKAGPLPPLQGSTFNFAGGKGFQRPFELATLRLRNMTEVLSHWSTYVPNPAYMTQRGGTFLFDREGNLVYQYRDRGILGFAENMSRPLDFVISI